MRILVTGATGFVGKYLLPLLNEHDVCCLIRRTTELPSNVKTITGSLASCSEWIGRLAEFKPDACIHLAWQGIPKYTIQNSNESYCQSINLLETLARVNCRTVFMAGTVFEYGSASGEVSEDSASINADIYPATKLALYEFARHFCANNAIRLIHGRFFYVYGPGQRRECLIPYVIETLRAGKEPNLKTPAAVADYIHATDISRMILGLIESPDARGIYNLGNGKPYTSRSIAAYIRSRLAGGKESLEPTFDITAGNWADIRKLQEIVRGNSISLADGINQYFKSECIDT